MAQLIVVGIIGFFIGGFTLALRADHFCDEYGFDNWDAKGCYNEDQVYQQDLIGEKE